MNAQQIADCHAELGFLHSFTAPFTKEMKGCEDSPSSFTSFTTL
jgi:hypothetical protein